MKWRRARSLILGGGSLYEAVMGERVGMRAPFNAEIPA